MDCHRADDRYMPETDTVFNVIYLFNAAFAGAQRKSGYVAITASPARDKTPLAKQTNRAWRLARYTLKSPAESSLRGVS